MNPLEVLMGLASGAAGAQALGARDVGPQQAVAQGEGLMVKRRGSVAWEPLESGGALGLEDMVRFPAGGQLVTATGGPQRVGPDALMVWTEGGWGPASPTKPRVGPVVSGAADFSPGRNPR